MEIYNATEAAYWTGAIYICIHIHIHIDIDISADFTL